MQLNFLWGCLYCEKGILYRSSLSDLNFEVLVEDCLLDASRVELQNVPDVGFVETLLSWSVLLLMASFLYPWEEILWEGVV